MKFKNFFKKSNRSDRPQQKIPRVDLTKSIYLRRTKKTGRYTVEFFQKNRPAILQTAVFRKEGKNAARKLQTRSTPLLPSDGDSGYNPFLLNPGASRNSVCDQRLQRREVLFATGIAGVNKRLSPGQGGSYKPSQGPCDRRI